MFTRLASDLCTASGHDELWRGQNLPGKRALDSKISYDDSILGVLAPSFKKLPGQPGLQHAGGGHHYAWPCSLQISGSPQLLDMLELEGIRSLHIRLI